MSAPVVVTILTLNLVGSLWCLAWVLRQARRDRTSSPPGLTVVGEWEPVPKAEALRGAPEDYIIHKPAYGPSTYFRRKTEPS